MKNIISVAITVACFFVVHIPFALAVIDITPEFSAREEYTDNLFLYSESNEEHEFITLLSPGVTIDFRGKSANLALNYNPTYAKYSRFNELNTWRHNADIQVNYALGRSTNFQIADTFFQTEDPAPRASTIATDSTVRGDRRSYYMNHTDASLTHDFGPQDSFILGYRYRMLENEDEDISDTQDHSPYLSLEYWFIPNSYGVFTDGEYTRGQIEDDEDFETLSGLFRLNKQINRHFIGFIQYTHIQQIYDGATEDYQVYNPAIGFQYEGAGDTSISLAIGYYTIERENGDTKGDVSYAGDISKTWTDRRTTFTLDASSGYTENLVSAEQLGYTFFITGSGRLSYPFTRSLNGNLFAAHDRNQYLDTDYDRIDDLTSAGVGIDWLPVSWLGIRLDYTYRKLASTIKGIEWDENRVILEVTLRPERPFSFNR